MVLGGARSGRSGALLARLSVFEGGASLEAFHAVCNPEGAPAEALLAVIMDKTSLVVVEAGDDAQPRLAMLDTVREFAAEQVDDAGRARAPPRARTSSTTPSARPRRRRARDRRAWLSRLARERGNLRVAFERLLRAGAAEDALRIAIAFARALPWDAHAHEVRGWLRRRSSSSRPSPARGAPPALYWDGQLALSQARFAEAEAPLEQALDAARALGDRRARGRAR